MKKLSIFEPQIENYYASTRPCKALQPNHVTHFLFILLSIVLCVGSKTPEDVDPIVAALPDAATNKETYWQIKRSLDSSNFRNIALEVWNNTKAGLEH